MPLACLSIFASASVARAEPASANTAITPVTEQPKRSAKDAARIAAAEQALIRAAATARSGGALETVCGGVSALAAAIGDLARIQPPAGFERELTEARNGLVTQVDHIQHSLCTVRHPDPPEIEDVGRALNKQLRTSFGRFQRIGKAPAGSPEARARAMLDTQIEALDDQDPLQATFTPKAFVLTPGGVVDLNEPNLGLLSIADLNPHAVIDRVTFDHFTSGSVGQLTWFAADLHITVTSYEPEYPPSTASTTVRALELLDGAAGGKVAVAAFTRVSAMHKSAAGAVHDATRIGPLTRLLLSPPALADSLASNAVVYGSDLDERGQGDQQAKALLAKWKTLAITLAAPPTVQEVRGATYGYAMANVRIASKPGGPAYDLRAFVLALPTSNGAWSVIGASFSAR